MAKIQRFVKEQTSKKFFFTATNVLVFLR